MGKFFYCKIKSYLDKKDLLLQIQFPIYFILIFFLLVSVRVNGQVVIKEKVEINPQIPVLHKLYVTEHTLRVDMQWTPINIEGWILFYSPQCGGQNTPTGSSSEGTASYSVSYTGYEYYNIQLRFNIPCDVYPRSSVEGNYQVYLDGQIIQQQNFTVGGCFDGTAFPHYNVGWSNPMRTDYSLNILKSQLCYNENSSIQISTTANCQATTEINTLTDPIKLNIVEGAKFVSFDENEIRFCNIAV